MTANRTPRGRRGHLTIEQRFSLLIGGNGVYRDAFESDQERRQAWFKSRDYFLSTFNYGKRPSAWWEYESPIDRPPDRRVEAATLYAMKLLPAKEADQLRDYWRQRWEQAYETEDFAYSLGPDQWLFGDAARRAHFRMYGILPALVEQWEAERHAG